MPYDGARGTVPVESLIESFEPYEDPIDRRIFFEITGLRLDDHDFRDDSPNEEDDGLKEGLTYEVLDIDAAFGVFPAEENAGDLGQSLRRFRSLNSIND